MNAEEYRGGGCLIVTRFIPCESSSESDRNVSRMSGEDIVGSDILHSKARSLVRRAFEKTIDEITEMNLHDLFELGKATASFDYLTGIYTVTNYITPRRVAKTAVKTLGTEAMYWLVNNNTRFRSGLCRHVNAYMRSHREFDGMKAKVGIHSFDDLVSLCEDDQD